MFHWFKKKAKTKPYPAEYFEWLKEFERIGEGYLSENDYTTFSGGALIDYKYSADNFLRELGVFLEKQLNIFFQNFSKDVQALTEENNCEYLLLVIRRYNKRYRNLFFFESLQFLDEKYRKKLSEELKEKLHEYYRELIRYFDKISEYCDSMSVVSINLKRLIQM